MLDPTMAALVTGIVSMLIFSISAALYVDACEKCGEYAKRCKKYEMHMKSRNNPSMQEMAQLQGIAAEAISQFQWKRFMRSVYFVAQVLAAMTVLGTLIYLAIRLS